MSSTENLDEGPSPTPGGSRSRTAAATKSSNRRGRPNRPQAISSADRPAAERSSSAGPPDAQELPRIGRNESVTAYAIRVVAAAPARAMALEREGLEIKVIKALAREMKLPISEVYEIIGVPRSTAEKKATDGGLLDGAPGHAALALLRLLGKAHGIVDDSTDPAAASFETTRWLGEWIRKPQPPLGGRAPVELLDTPTGAASVMRVLGALESGAYQ